MSHRLTKKQRRAKKQMKRVIMRHTITVFALLALVIIGLVSTTFASFVSNSVTNEGSLIADIQTAAVNRDAKKDLAETNANVASGHYLYFDNSLTGFNESVIQYMIGHGTYSTTYQMSKLENTELYYKKMDYFGGATQIAVIGASGVWGSENNGLGSQPNTRKTWAPEYSGTYYINSAWDSNNVTLLVPSAAANGSAIDASVLNKSSDTMNTAQNAVAQAASAGSSTYSDNAKGGTVKVSSYELDSEKTSTNATSGQSTSSNATASAKAVKTAKVTMTATPADGYNFIGWYNSSGTLQTTDATFTYYCSGSTATYYARFQQAGYSFTVTAGKGGNVSSDPATGPAASAEITATPNDGYEFAGWEVTGGSVLDTSDPTTTFTITAADAEAKAVFRPNTPTDLELTASNYVPGTNGDGTSGNPYIVFDDRGFTIEANSTVPEGSLAYYSTSLNGEYKTDNTFNPQLTNKGTPIQFTVYAKSKADVFSSTYTSKTAYYMVFSHLTRTSFKISALEIEDDGSITLSDPEFYNADGIISAPEKEYITHTYQISNDDLNFTDLPNEDNEDSYTWSPDAAGTYYFRLKAENTKTGESVCSESERVEVKQSTVYYDITVSGEDAVVTLKTNGTTITDGKILNNSPLSLSIVRDDKNQYFKYIKVNDKTIVENYNGDFIDTDIIDHVKDNVKIEYLLVDKPRITVKVPENSTFVSFKYSSDGVEKTVTVSEQSIYYVDYYSNIYYTVTPKDGYYVSNMTGVNPPQLVSGTVTGTRENVKRDFPVGATISENQKFKVKIDSLSDVPTGGSMLVNGVAKDFNTDIPVEYGKLTKVVITPPAGCYAFVSGNSVSANIGDDGIATFTFNPGNEYLEYTVKFIHNPKIKIKQPQYGSIYVTSVTDNNTKYYFNGDSVAYGTELTVHVKPDHANALIEDVLVNDASIGTTDGSKFKIYEDSTASATITVDDKHTFADGTDYGNRRIFFTDNSGWGDGQVMVHYSNNNNDTNFTDGHTVEMEYKFTNDASQRVYYADIPYSAKYVNFYNKSATSNYTASALITNDANGFWHEGGNAPYAINPWQENYSDYVATDRETTFQQAKTLKNETVKFKYTCDFGDATLTAEAVAGNAITYDFDKGTLYITPTDNKQSFSLVKVESSASTTVKYYLIKVDSFEIVDFSGLQKIYNNTSAINSITLQLIVKGGTLNYASSYFVSKTNLDGSYTSLKGTEGTFTQTFTPTDSIQCYINSFIFNHELKTAKGARYYKVEVTDGTGNKSTRTLKTLFGTNQYSGNRNLYFYNGSGENLSSYNVRAYFTGLNNAYAFVTLQRVGTTNYYRATIPNNANQEVSFYICNKDVFSNDYTDYSGESAAQAVYSFKSGSLDVPADDNGNIVYNVTSLSGDSISGGFTDYH